MRRWWMSLGFSLAGLCSEAAAWPQWSLEIDRLSLGEASLGKMRLAAPVEGGDTGIALSVESVTPGSDSASHGPFTLQCDGDLAAVIRELCRDGQWVFSVGEQWPSLRGKLEQVTIEGSGLSIETRGNFDTLDWSARLESSGGTFSLNVKVPEQAVDRLTFLQDRVPQLGWVSAGRLAGSANISGGAGQQVQARAGIDFTDLDFDSPDGLYAGLGVGVGMTARLESPSDLAFTLEGQLSTGELLLKDFYRDFSGKSLDLSARVAISDEFFDLKRIMAGDGDALYLAGQARLPRSNESAAPVLLLRELRLNFPEAYVRYIEPMATVLRLDGLETSGELSWAGDWAPGSARSGQLRFEGLSIADSRRGRFGLRGLEGTLETGAASRLSWQAASFEKLDLGTGSAAIALSEDSMRLLEPLSIDVFGGALSLESLTIGFPRGGDPDIQLRADIRDIEMKQMSAALGWPQFAGTLSGSIPGINWTEGVIEIQGALDFEVFGGQVLLSDLRVERPFGVLPSLAANITATALDLEQVTQTFDFGRIAGRIDGYVRNLRMLDWEPVQFDAWFGTPAEGGRNDISRQAVRHLATIGGGSPTALLTGPVLRLFNNFSYRRLGLGCRLEDNVCQIRGIEEQGDAVLLLDGAGIPKISILAYNRAVDWPQLVAELTAVSSGEEVRIGQ